MSCSLKLDRHESFASLKELLRNMIRSSKHCFKNKLVFPVIILTILEAESVIQYCNVPEELEVVLWVGKPKFSPWLEVDVEQTSASPDSALAQWGKPLCTLQTSWLSEGGQFSLRFLWVSTITLQSRKRIKKKEKKKSSYGIICRDRYHCCGWT